MRRRRQTNYLVDLVYWADAVPRQIREENREYLCPCLAALRKGFSDPARLRVLHSDDGGAAVLELLLACDTVPNRLFLFLLR